VFVCVGGGAGVHVFLQRVGEVDLDVQVLKNKHRYARAQYDEVCCNVLQCVSVCCSVLQCVAVWHKDAVWRSLEQCVAVCCSMLQIQHRNMKARYAAMCCSAV